MATKGLESKYTNVFDALLDSDSDSDAESDNNSTNTNVDESETNNIDQSKVDDINDSDSKYDDKIDKIEKLDKSSKYSSDKYVPPTNISLGNNSWNTSTKKKRKRKEELQQYNVDEIYKGDELELNDIWNVYTHSNSNNDWSIKSYELVEKIKNVGDMWRFLNIMDNLDKEKYQYFVMRKDITPIWEDNKNKNGGICSIAIKNRYNHNFDANVGICAFISICMLVMNETFVTENSIINGMSFSVKSRNVLIKLWVSDYEDNENFHDKLPLALLRKLEDIITKSSNRYRNDRMAVSVQYKKIQPDY
jgi:hypothetical protein